MRGEAEVHNKLSPWTARLLLELGQFVGGAAFPLRYQYQSVGDFPFYKVANLGPVEGSVHLLPTMHYIDEDVRHVLGAKVIPKEAVIFAKIGAAIALERKRISREPSCIDNNMMAFIANPEILSSAYAKFLFDSISLYPLIEQTAVPSLSAKRVGQITVRLPSLSEQQAIAAILDTLDAAIERTDALIAKLALVRRGVAQHLLEAIREMLIGRD